MSPPASTNRLPERIRSLGRIHHVAVIVAKLDPALAFWRDALGLELEVVEDMAHDRVRIAFLPVGESNPRVRLARLSYAMRGIAQHGQSVGADSLIALTGFAPPTLHALGARAARGLSRRLFNLVVTNVPGPQFPLYAAGSRMLEVFPVVPLARGQGLSIGMTSYDGRVYFGLNADRDSVGDVDVLADLIEQEVAELVEAAG